MKAPTNLEARTSISDVLFSSTGERPERTPACVIGVAQAFLPV